MTDEQLKKGQDLKTRIDRLKSRIESWEKGTKITEIRIQYPNIYPSENRIFADDGAYVNFGVFKTLALQSMHNRLEELEKEYAEL